MEKLKKGSSDLYSLLGNVLDCNYNRLIDAIDDVNGNTLKNAVYKARAYGPLSLGSIMSEVIVEGINQCRVNFLNRIDALNASNKELPDEIEEFDIDILADSIRYEDGLIFSEDFGGYSEEDMKGYLKYFKYEFAALQELIGKIDGLPQIGNTIIIEGKEALSLLSQGKILYNEDLHYNYRLNSKTNEIEFKKENAWSISGITIHDFLQFKYSVISEVD